ncbi:MAG: hypothetical protein ACRDJE_29260 [Dehalococcoidia bacterium]
MPRHVAPPLVMFILAVSAGAGLIPSPAPGRTLAQPAPAPQLPGTYVLNLSTGTVLSVGGVLASGFSPETAWSPDGSRLAVAGSPDESGSGGGLQIVDLAGGATVVATAEQGRASQLAFSPDGSRLAFIFEGAIGPITVDSPALYIWPVSGGAARQMLSAGVLTFAWTPDSAAITVSQFLPGPSMDAPSGRMVTLDARSGDVINTPLQGENATCAVGLAWSPDGAYLAYGGSGFHQGCGTDPNGFGLWSWEAAAGTSTRLFTGTAAAPLWQADGSILDTVAGTTDPSALPISLRSFRPDGSGSTILVDSISNQFPAPDNLFQTAAGVVMYGLSGCDAASAWVIDPGSTPRRLSAPSVFAYRPQLSPDGRTVAWVAVGSSSSDLVLAAEDGSSARMVLSGASGMTMSPGAWSPDGTALVFAVTAEQATDCLPE